MDTDQEAMGLLDQAAVSYVLALTKIDQLSVAERTQAQIEILEVGRRHTAAYPEAFATSALKNLGLDALKAHIAALAAN
jgi:GTP-binding protein